METYKLDFIWKTVGNCKNNKKKPLAPKFASQFMIKIFKKFLLALNNL